MFYSFPISYMETSKGSQAAIKPVFKCKFGAIAASVFANEVTDGDNKPSIIHAVQLQRTYKKADGKWATSSTLREQDLLNAAFALEKCFEFIHQK
jgi:hypothetical protein